MNQTEIIFNNKRLQGRWRDEADESVWAEIFKWREYRAADAVIKKARWIFDIGAHAGFFTLYAKSLNPTVNILSVEPAAENLAAAEATLQLNAITNGVTLLAGALVPAPGEYVLQLADDSHNHQVMRKETKGSEDRTVTGYVLAELLQKSGSDTVDLMKMDIEGGETAIIESWSAADWQRVRHLIMEYHAGTAAAEKLQGILNHQGFSVQLFPSRFDKNMGIIWARNKRVE